MFCICDRTLFFPYCTTGSRIFFRIGRPIRFFFRIVHYVREVTRWFLSSASKLFLIVIYFVRKYKSEIFEKKYVLYQYRSRKL
jgi:hypothetical protein